MQRDGPQLEQERLVKEMAGTYITKTPIPEITLPPILELLVPELTETKTTKDKN